MSWLSSLVHNVQKIDPVGTAVASALGDKNAAGRQDAANSQSTPAASTASTASTSNSSQGDASSPDYGSFTKPFDVQSFYQNLDPGYLFRLQTGQQGVVNSAAAGSGALSGSAMKDLMDYNQNAASSEYNNAYNRYQTTQGNIFNRLYSIAGLGQASASNTAANNTNLANSAAQSTQNAGTASGAGIVGAGNAVSNGLSTYGAYNYLNNRTVTV